MDKENKDNHTLRVFEAFAGIGAQASALDRMGINYKIVGISEWFIDAIEFTAIMLKSKCLRTFRQSMSISPSLHLAQPLLNRPTLNGLRKINAEIYIEQISRQITLDQLLYPCLKLN